MSIYLHYFNFFFSNILKRIIMSHKYLKNFIIEIKNTRGMAKGLKLVYFLFGIFMLHILVKLIIFFLASCRMHKNLIRIQK